MTVLMHDNGVYGLTKKQVSPTSPQGLKTNTTPRGSYLPPLNPLSTTLGVANASFVAQAVDWIPETLYDIISAAFHHNGFSFVRILQRCPEFMPDTFDPWVQNPQQMLLLEHPDGLQLSPALAKVYTNQEAHDPADINRAREIASNTEIIPVGVLYRNEEIPRYDDMRRPRGVYTNEKIRAGIEEELDKYTI